MTQIVYPSVLEAWAKLKALPPDGEASRLAEVRERALMSERTEIEAAFARGIENGIESSKESGIKASIEAGIEIGFAEAKAEMLRYVIESGIPEAQARAILHM